MGPTRGREREQHRVRALIEAATEEPVAAVIEGEAGIGKSVLLDEALELGRRAGLQVVFASAHELEQDRPFGPLIDALKLRPDSKDPVRAELARRILGTGPDAGPGAVRHAIVEGLTDVLQGLGDQQPVLLAVEDLHWADASTLVALGRIARVRAHLSVSLFCTTRPTGGVPEREALLRTLDAMGAARIELVALSEDVVNELITDVVGAAPGPNLLARAAGASGNPLYIIEVVRTLLQDELVQIADGVADIKGIELPPSVRQTLLRRISFLPAPTLAVLRVAAILGAAFRTDELAAVTGRQTAALLEALRPAIEAQLLAADADGLRFRHDLIHEAAYLDVPAPIRAALHLDVARALATAGFPILRVAAHLERTSVEPLADASDLLWEAGVGLERANPAGALRHWTSAVARTPIDHPRRSERRALEVYAALRARGVDATARARALLDEDLDEVHRWVIEQGLAGAYAGAGQLELADEVAFARPRPVCVQAQVAGIVGSAHLTWGDFAGAEAVVHSIPAPDGASDARAQEFYRLIGIRVPDDQMLVDFNVAGVMSTRVCLEGRGREAGALFVRHSELLEAFGNPPEAAHGGCILGLALCDRHAEAAQIVARVRDTDLDVSLPDIDVGGGVASWLVGDWDAAEVQLETAMAAGGEVGSLLVITLATGALAAIAIHRDDLAGARRWLAEFDRIGVPATGFMTWVRALVLQADGRTTEAAAVLAESWRLDSAFGIHFLQPHYAADLVLLALATGDHALTTEVTEAMEGLATLADTDSARGAALRCRGLLDADAVLLTQAAEAYASAGRPFERALCLEDAAVAMSADGDREVAVGRLEEAIAEYERVGAARDLTRALRRLRDLGGRRRRSATAARPAAGWDSLTEAEQRVTDLIAERLTYREIGARLFISRRTVETHAANIFVKLGVRSKGELATAYANRPR